MEKVEFN